MKVLVNSIGDILNLEDLEERGILITLLLLKEKNPKMTLAKFKASVVFNKELKLKLKSLHNAKYIIWSGLKSFEKSLLNKPNPDVELVLDFMSSIYNRKFGYNISNTKALSSILKDYSVEDVKKVVTNRYAEWKDDSFMKKYLKPKTLFRKSNFTGYLEEANHSKVGVGIIEAEKINLKFGDTITFEISKSLVDREIYGVKIFTTNDSGKKSGRGKVEKRYGSDIKRMVKLQENLLKRGRKKEFEYEYAEI